MKQKPFTDLLRFILLLSIATALLLIEGSETGRVHALKQKTLRVATLGNRSGKMAIEAKKAIRRVYKDTEGRVKVRMYWSGSAGDDETVLRKMRVGQIDGTFLNVDILRRIVPMAMILAAPRTYTNYRQVAAVRKELSPEFEKVAMKNGFKVFNWIDIGKLRIFSATPIRTYRDILKTRAWLYEHSPLLKEFYRMIGATGVPVGLTSVYSALQTGMIDLVWASCFTASVLRWYVKMKYFSPPAGFIQGAFVIRKAFWDSLTKSDQAALVRMSKENANSIQAELRKTDERTFHRLKKRGMKRIAFQNTQEWRAMGKRLREKMIGRIYDRQTLSRVEKIVAKYPDRPSDRL